MARVKGLKRENGKRHQVVIQDTTDDGVDDNYPIWVGTSIWGKPEAGAYVSRRKFLQAVATALNVLIEDPDGDYYGP